MSEFQSFIRPAPGLVIRDPMDMSVLPAEGKTVVGNQSFWIRRIKAGDVVEGAQEQPSPVAKAEQAKESTK